MPWEIFKPKATTPDNSFKGVVSIRKEDIGIARDLADKYFQIEGKLSKVSIFINQETGEVGLRPDKKGHASRAKSDNACLVLRARHFLKEYPLRPGSYQARWDPEESLLIIQAWPKPEPKQPVPKEPEPKLPDESPKQIGPMTEICPVCGKGGFVKGACDSCGFDEGEGVECPEGLIRPFEKPEICKECKKYKRGYGSYPAKCLWDEWVIKEE